MTDSQPEAVKGNRGAGGHPILLVEDDPDIRESIALLLRDEGYRVFEAPDGQAGFDVLRTMPRPCIILLDMMMPVLDGHGFMELLRSDEVLVSIPVVVVSAGRSGVPAGIHKFLRKPFEIEALVHTIREYCDRP